METHEPVSQAAMEQNRENPGEEDHKSGGEAGEAADVAAQMAKLQVCNVEQPKMAGSKGPEHVVPSAAFTFERPIWSPDLNVDIAVKMPEWQADDTTKTVPARPNHMLPAFKFKLPTHAQRLLFDLPVDEDENVDEAAKMDDMPAYIDIYSPKPVPQHAEPEVPSATFTFTSTVRNPLLRPKLGLKKRKSTDLAAKMAELQVRVAKQPPETAREHSAKVVPNSAFRFTAATQSREPGSTSQTKSGATLPIEAQDAAPKTLPKPQEQSLTTATSLFTTPTPSGRSESTSDVKSSATTDVRQTARMLKAGPLDKADLVTGHDSQTATNARIEARAREFLSKLLKFVISRVLIKDRSDLMEPICNFANPPRTAKPLYCLPREFWQVLDQCCEANAARKTLETELHDVKLERSERYEKCMDEYVESMTLTPVHEFSNRITRGQQHDTAQLAVQFASPGNLKGLDGLDDVMKPGMYRVGELEGLIEKARSECSKHEAKLNNIAYNSLLQLGLIPASVIARVS